MKHGFLCALLLALTLCACSAEAPQPIAQPPAELVQETPTALPEKPAESRASWDLSENRKPSKPEADPAPEEVPPPEEPEEPEPPGPEEAPEPEDTLTLFVDGVRLEDCPVWEGAAYCPLEAVAEIGGGTFDPGSLLLDVWGTALMLAPDSADEAFSAEALLRYRDGTWYAPAGALMAELGLNELQDPEAQQIYYTHLPASAAIPAGRAVVVLRMHCVSDDVWGQEDLFLSPDKLEAQISLLEEMGCSFLTFEDLPELDRYEKPVLLTFDDGYRDNYLELYPMLQQHQIKATIFVATGLIGREKFLTEDMIREMDASGLVSFQSHTVSHRDVDTLTSEEQIDEFSRSQLDLARITGKIPFALSFPEAHVTAEATLNASRFYSYIVVRDGFAYQTGTDPLKIPRFGIPREMTIEAFRSCFSCFG